MQPATVSIDEAVRLVLGNKLAETTTSEMGLHWTVVMAMTVATTDDDPRALEAIRQWNAAVKAQGE